MIVRPVPAVIVAIRRVIRGVNHFLYHKRSSGQWAFPGGHLEMFESFKDCAIKEILEECGPELRTTEPKLWTVVDNQYPEEGRHYVVIVMKCDWSAGEAEIMEPLKCQCWDWSPWYAPPMPLIKSQQQLKDLFPCYE